MSIEERYDEVRQLIQIGKEKGYLLYDEVNEMLPSEITSSEDLDDLFNAFGSAGIEVVDSDKAYRGDKDFDRDGTGTAPSSTSRRAPSTRPTIPSACTCARWARSAAHPRGRGGDRQAHRARQARGDQVDLAHAHDRQAHSHHRRPAARRRAHHPRAGDLQRRGDHRRGDPGARRGSARADRERGQGARRLPPSSPRSSKRSRRRTRRSTAARG